MPQPRVLIVEDHPTIRRGLVMKLRQNGYQVEAAESFHRGMELGMARDYDLLLLDLTLPGGSGLDILRSIRAVSTSTPIVILTAMGEETERVIGLKAGADDYVVKPFSAPELLARIEAVLRRSPARMDQVRTVLIPGGTIDLSQGVVHHNDGLKVELSEREVELLAFLSQQAGRVVSRPEILAQVWHLNPDSINTRTIDVHIARIREKLRDTPDDPKIIRTYWGRGYQFLPGLES